MLQPRTPQPALLRKLEELNNGRSLWANLGAFVCVLGMMGAANYVCRFALQADMSYVLRILVVAVACYFLLPPLILWVWRGRSSGQ